MEDEYYTVNGFIAHKSCTFDGHYFSNAKYFAKYFSNDKYCYNGDDFITLEKRCNLVDKITENINLPMAFSKCGSAYSHCCHIYLRNNNTIEHWSGDKYHKTFESYEEFYDFMCLNYPHLIKSHDIKIALKD
jgi:hypothetical protein